MVLDDNYRLITVFGKAKILLVDSQDHINKDISDCVSPAFNIIFKKNLSRAKNEGTRNFSEKIISQINGVKIEGVLKFTYVENKLDHDFYIVSLLPIPFAPQDFTKDLFLKEIQQLESVGSFYHDLKEYKTYISSEISKIFELESDKNFNILFNSKYFDEHSNKEIASNLLTLKSSGEQFQGAYTINTELGKTKLIKLQVKAIDLDHNGEISGYVGTIKDSTQQNLAQERTKLALSASGASFWEWDIETNEVFFDEKLLALYEFPSGIEPTKLFETWAETLVGDDRAMATQALKDAVTGKKEYNLYFRIKTPSGVIKYIHATGKVIKDRNGIGVRMLGAKIDVTDILKKEELIKEQRRVADVSVRMAQLGELSMELGHEINNPLTICMSSVSLLKINLKEVELNEKSHRSLELLTKGLDRINSLVKNLRNYLNSSNGDILKEIDVNNAIRENCSLVENLTNKSKATFELDLCSSLFIECDSVKISQVLFNLLSNAIYAVKNSEQKIIRVSTFTQEGRALVKVDDSGCGISLEHQEKIFEKFFTTKGLHDGTGIGLSLCREIIENMGGTINYVPSSLGGACFLISLNQSQKKKNIKRIEVTAKERAS